MESPLLRLENIHKAFGPVRALRGVDLNVYPGEVHGLIGENGAGKSTLMKVLSGVHSPDEGRMSLAGTPYVPTSPLEGRAAGISMIYQELTLAPHLSVEQNITLGMEQARYGWITSQTEAVREALSELGQASIDPQAPVNALSMGKQQIVEIARALLTEAKIVVMDEPTSSLAADDARALFQVIRRLKDKGVAVIYISHFLEEVEDVCDRFTVLRDGEAVATGLVAETEISDIITHMVGRSVDELYPPHSDHSIGEEVLKVSGLSGQGQTPKLVSFSLRRGEILGIAGLVGAGRSETIRALFGLEEAEEGTLSIAGRADLKVAWMSPQRALQNGINLLSENRKDEGLAQNLSILTNLTLSGLKRYSRFGFVNLKQEDESGRGWVDKLRIKTQNAYQPASSLSGGNQQKVCIARMLHQNSDILFLDEPTRGIDIGSKAEIYQLVHALAGEGKAIVMVSSYLPELLGICDTIGVMHKGVLSDAKPVEEWTEHRIMEFATSGK
jgi:ribose transport system ATP-binding protein